MKLRQIALVNQPTLGLSGNDKRPSARIDQLPLAWTVLDQDAIGTLSKFSKTWGSLYELSSVEESHLGLKLNLPSSLLARRFVLELKIHIESQLSDQPTPGYGIDESGDLKILNRPTSTIKPGFGWLEHVAEPAIFTTFQALLLAALSTAGDNPDRAIAESSTIYPAFERNIIVIGFMVFFVNMLLVGAQLLPILATRNRTHYGILKPYGPASVNLIHNDQSVEGHNVNDAPQSQKLSAGAPIFESAHGVLIVENPSNANRVSIGTRLAQPTSGDASHISPVLSAVIVDYKKPTHNQSNDYLVTSGRFIEHTSPVNHPKHWEISTHSAILKSHLQNISPNQFGIIWNDKAVQTFLSNRPTMTQRDWLILYGAQANAVLSHINQPNEQEITVTSKDIETIRNILDGTGQIDFSTDHDGNGFFGMVDQIWNDPSKTVKFAYDTIDQALETYTESTQGFGTLVGHDNQLQRYAGLIRLNALLQAYWEYLASTIKHHDQLSELWIPPNVSLLIIGDYSGGKSTVLNRLENLNSRLTDEYRNKFKIQKPISFITRTENDAAEIQTRTPDQVPTKNLLAQITNPQLIPYIIKAAYCVYLSAHLVNIFKEISELNEDNSIVLMAVLPVSFQLLITALTIGGHYVRRNDQIKHGLDQSIVVLDKQSHRTDLSSTTSKISLLNQYKYAPNPQHRTQLNPAETSSGIQKTFVIEELDKITLNEPPEPPTTHIARNDVVSLIRGNSRQLGAVQEKYRALFLCAANDITHTSSSKQFNTTFNHDLVSQKEEFRSEFEVEPRDLNTTRARLLLWAYQAAKATKKVPTVAQLKGLVDLVLRPTEGQDTYTFSIKRGDLKNWTDRLNLVS